MAISRSRILGKWYMGSPGACRLPFRHYIAALPRDRAHEQEVVQICRSMSPAYIYFPLPCALKTPRTVRSFVTASAVGDGESKGRDSGGGAGDVEGQQTTQFNW